MPARSQRLVFFAFLFTTLFISTALPGGAALAAEKPDPHKMGEVTVEGRKIEERLSAELAEFGHQVTVIQGKDISEGGFVDLYQALEAMVPGLFIAQKNGRGDYARQYLHGSDTILWLLDGVRINNRLYGKGYIDTISVRNIERVEVLYGGEGLFYGTESTAGVINIITKSVAKETSGEVGAGYGGYKAREVYGHVTGTIGGNGFMVFGSHDGWDGYQPYDDDAYRKAGNPNHENREFNRTNLGLKYERKFDIAGQAKIKAHLQRNIGKFDFARPDERHALNDRTQDIGILKWDHDVTDNFSYYVKGFLHRWWTDYTRQRLDGSYVYNKAVWGFQDWGVNLLSSYRFGGGHEVLCGLDYQNYFGDDAVTDIYTDNEEVKAAFAQYRPYLPFAPKLKTAFGARYNQTGDNDKTVWNVSARSPLLGGTYFRGNLGTSFILPTAEQLWQNDQDSQKFGNPDLKPQESLNLDVGLGGQWSLLWLEVGYFQQELKDRIAFSNNTYRNIDDKLNLRGYEVQGRIGPWQGFTLGASYTYTDVEMDGASEQLNRIPEYMAKANLQWRHSLSHCRVGADLFARWVGKIHDYSQEYGKYWLLDASGFVAFGQGNRHRIVLRLENLLDEDYDTQLSRTRDADGNLFIYAAKGIPFNAVLTYSYLF